MTLSFPFLDKGDGGNIQCCMYSCAQRSIYTDCHVRISKSLKISGVAVGLLVYPGFNAVCKAYANRKWIWIVTGIIVWIHMIVSVWISFHFLGTTFAGSVFAMRITI